MTKKHSVDRKQHQTQNSISAKLSNELNLSETQQSFEEEYKGQSNSNTISSKQKKGSFDQCSTMSKQKSQTEKDL